ncbi:hypothetical protein KHA80_02280 [Anaerobacillus sp. HL2]|nr:hypothetical protein KHA80_02280 [Anaerobacillus sp. HL2]
MLVVKKLRVEGVHEIVPVGSKGIAYELEELLKRNKLMLERRNKLEYQEKLLVQQLVF